MKANSLREGDRTRGEITPSSLRGSGPSARGSRSNENIHSNHRVTPPSVFNAGLAHIPPFNPRRPPPRYEYPSSSRQDSIENFFDDGPSSPSVSSFSNFERAFRRPAYPNSESALRDDGGRARGPCPFPPDSNRGGRAGAAAFRPPLVSLETVSEPRGAGGFTPSLQDSHRPSSLPHHFATPVGIPPRTPGSHRGTNSIISQQRSVLASPYEPFTLRDRLATLQEEARASFDRSVQEAILQHSQRPQSPTHPPLPSNVSSVAAPTGLSHADHAALASGLPRLLSVT